MSLSHLQHPLRCWYFCSNTIVLLHLRVKKKQKENILNISHNIYMHIYTHTYAKERVKVINVSANIKYASA